MIDLMKASLVSLIRRTRRLQRLVLRSYYSFRVRLTCGSAGPDLRVNYFSSVTSNTHLGRNVNFNGMVIMGCGKVTIGDNFHSGGECVMISQNHKYDDGAEIPYDSKVEVPTPIVIEDNVWLGSRVMVLGGVRIGEGAIIQAGSVVVSDVPRCAIAGGHPARVFKHRDVPHYEKLKAQGRFS